MNALVEQGIRSPTGMLELVIYGFAQELVGWLSLGKEIKL